MYDENIFTTSFFPEFLPIGFAMNAIEDVEYEEVHSEVKPTNINEENGNKSNEADRCGFIA